MKKLLMLVVVSSLAVACSSQKEPAEAAVNGLETAAAAAKPNIEQFAADRMTGVETATTRSPLSWKARDAKPIIESLMATLGISSKAT